jgi:hypothetical protein
MSLAINLPIPLSHSGVELVYSPEWTKIFRTKAFTIATELFALLTIFIAVGIWVFILPSAY